MNETAYVPVEFYFWILKCDFDMTEFDIIEIWIEIYQIEFDIIFTCHKMYFFFLPAT